MPQRARPPQPPPTAASDASGPNDGADFVALARVGRPVGLDGSVAVFPHNADSQLLGVGQSLLWRGPDGTTRRHTIVAVKPGARRTTLRFADVTGRAAAESLTHGDLGLPRAELPALAPDEVYLEDLRGLQAFDLQGRALGEVVGFMTTTIDIVFLNGPAGEVLVPLLDNVIVSVDRVAGRVVLDPPPGLLDP